MLGASIVSGSYETFGMAVAPCAIESMSVNEKTKPEMSKFCVRQLTLNEIGVCIMAIIEILLVDDSTQEQREKLMVAVTTAATECLSAPPGKVRTIIREVPKTHFAIGGVPKSRLS